MPVKFYRHTPVRNPNERRALYRVARLLYQSYAHRESDFILVANIENLFPGLPQLDALLFSDEGVSVLEFKDCFDPIDGENPNGRWFIRGTRHQVESGAFRNPYKQARNALTKWKRFFQTQSNKLTDPFRRDQIIDGWRQLSVCVLFHPYLHPDSKITIRGQDKFWLSFQSIDEIVAHPFRRGPTRLRLQPAEMLWFVEDVLDAQPWPELEQLIDEIIGVLYVSQPTGQTIVYYVRRFDTFTIGRSRHNKIRIHSDYKRVSKSHARVESQLEAVRLYDMNSRYNTFVNVQKVDSEAGILLQEGDTIYLGGRNSGCQIRFEARFSQPAESDSGTSDTGVTE